MSKEGKQQRPKKNMTEMQNTGDMTMSMSVADQFVAEGIVIGEAKSIIRILTKNFGDVPPTICEKLHAIHDLDVLGKLTDVALDCQTLVEFEKALNK